MSQGFLFSDARWRDIVLGMIVVCFVADTGASIIGGYDRLGGAWQARAILYASAMGALAVLGTWVPWQAGVLWREKRFVVSLICWAIALALFVFTQSNSFSVWGVGMADGAVVRDDAAGRRASLIGERERLEAERAAIGVVRAVASIQAEATLECSRTSSRYPDGRGPKCTALLAELGAAERAGEIDARLVTLRRDLAVAPKVAAGAHDVHVWIAVADAINAFWADPESVLRPVTEAEARFGWVIFVGLLVGIVANFGPVLFLSGTGAVPARLEPEPEPDPEWNRWRRQHMIASPEAAARMAMVWQAPPAPPAAEVMAGDVPAVQPMAPRAIEQPVVSAERLVELAPAAPASLMSPDAAHVPVTRGSAEELIDHLLVFRAACVADCAGSVVKVDDVWRRYASWAGEGAVAREVFDMLFAGVAGLKVVSYGAAPYVQDVMLRGAEMRQVG